ncbi:MAG: hypothetical protein M1820_008311 [Bogoriella megaspora]|nr:MAG: hypothetical protein M1820_008311 [Bogoriella megaspora]
MAAAYYYDPFQEESTYNIPQFDWASTGPEVVEVFKDRVENRNIVITGPSSGSLGGATVFSLASGSPNTIILVCRSLSSVQPVLDAIRFRYPDLTNSLYFVQCDLTSQASVRRAVRHISSLAPRIDILVNNAALPPGPYYESPEGVESQFATDHLGHFLFTNLLIPHLLQRPRPPGAIQPRIVTVSSSAHRYCTQSPAVNPNFNDGVTNGALYTPREGYVRSKAANILFARSLAEKLASSEILSFSVHPGSIETGLQDRIPASVLEQAEGAGQAEARASLAVSGTQRLSVSSEGSSRRGSEHHGQRSAGPASTGSGSAERSRQTSLQSGMSGMSAIPGTGAIVGMTGVPIAAEEPYAVQRAKRKTVDQGCATILVAALDPRIEGRSGSYLEDGKIVEDALRERMDRDEEGERLWELSESWVGETFSWG